MAAHGGRTCTRQCRLFVLLVLWLGLVGFARAVPAFARQTGQACASCHAGGQFPELTPFGRLFKLGGFSLGQRNPIPLAAMAIVSDTETRNRRSDTPAVDFPKDAALLFQTASVFAAGKINDHAGYFAQLTYDNYAQQDPSTLEWSGHTHADNIDIRYARQFDHAGHTFIAGLSLNNNPTVTDPWNTLPAWSEYVPTLFGFTGPPAEPLVAGLGQQVAGLDAYLLWNSAVYVEAGAYRSARGPLSVFGHGVELESRLHGTAPYLRTAFTRDWGLHNAMIGLFGMNAQVYADPAQPGGPRVDYHDRGLDAQYQYLGRGHRVTVQYSYIHESIRGGDTAGLAERHKVKLDQWRLRAFYTYRHTVGAGLSYFRSSGTRDSVLYPGSAPNGEGGTAPIPITGSALNSPSTRGWVPELFWTPVQYVRAGLQFYRFDRYNGRADNYDAAGRNARDNNTLFMYVWANY